VRGAPEPHHLSRLPNVSDQPDVDSLHAFVEALPQIAWTASVDGLVDYYNKRWVDYTGMSVEETRGWGWRPVLHPDDLNLCIERWQHAYTTGTPYEVEYRFRRASDGAFRWHLGLASPIRNATGAVVKWLGTCTDIHEQKEAAAALQRVTESARDAEARFRTVQDASPDSCILLEVIPEAAGEPWNARIAYANESATRLMERTPGSLTGRLLDEAFPGARSSGRYAIYAEVLRTGRTRSMTFFHEGVSKWLRIVIVKVGSGFCIISADVTDLKAAEAVLRRSHDELEQIVAERTAELMIAREVAEAASGAKSEFLSRASHELRTPLNAIIGFSALVLRNRAGTLGDMDLKYLARVSHNGRHLLALVNDLLDLSKIESGRLDLELGPVFLSALLEDVRATLGGAAAEAGLGLTVDLPAGELAVDMMAIADEQRLRQVLINLVGNAIKYAERGAVVVRVGVDPEGEPQRIDVVDTGVGIAPAEVDAMFEPFVIGPGAVSGDEATGLGLAISRSLCAAMGFRLTATSRPGEGSTFTIHLSMGDSTA
jgi:PAS domain S-box-containing protein